MDEPYSTRLQRDCFSNTQGEIPTPQAADAQLYLGMSEMLEAG